MIRFVAVLAFILGMAAFVPARAAEDMITVDLAEDHIDITAGFKGSHLVLFGMRPQPGEIAVVIRGPLRDAIVRRKQSIFGAWMNRASMRFRDVPVYYDYAMSAPGNQLAAESILDRYGIGLGALRFDSKDRPKKELKDFQDALIRNRQDDKFFPAEPQKIKFLNPNFFKAEFYLPASVPVGEYEVKTFYFSGGKVVDTKTNTIRVAQVGMNARIRGFSIRHAFVYGVLCVTLAIFAGWFSNRVRRRV